MSREGIHHTNSAPSSGLFSVDTLALARDVEEPVQFQQTTELEPQEEVIIRTKVIPKEDGGEILVTTRTTRRKKVRLIQNVTQRRVEIARNFEGECGDCKGEGHATVGLLLQHIPQRRESFLYRSDNDEDSSQRQSRNHSLTGDLFIPGLHDSMGSGLLSAGSTPSIVTPFAQILASLKKVRTNFMCLTSVTSTKDARFGGNSTASTRQQEEDLLKNVENRQNLAQETLQELEWCLENLETMQTHRSVSDMASSKFKRLLNKELSQFSESGKSDNQISEYICSTFLDAVQDGEDDPLKVWKEHRRSLAIHPSSAPPPLSSPVPRQHRPIPTLMLSTAEDDSDAKTEDEEDTREVPSQSDPSIASSTLPVDANSNEETQPPPTPTASDSFELPQKSSIHNHLPKHHHHHHHHEDVDTDRQSSPGMISLSEERGIPLTQVSGLQEIPSPSIEDATNSEDPLQVYLNVNATEKMDIDRMFSQSLDKWGMDIFEVCRLTKSKPLTAITFAVFEKHNLLTSCNIPAVRLARYLHQLEMHYYSDVPYHNSSHAADVTQSVHVLLQLPALSGVFADLEIMAIIFACAIHDVNHPGVTNQYLINSGDPLALLYNDASVLENHHLAVAFTLLKEDGCDIFSNLTKKQRQSLRRMSIDMVLATDMSKHMTLLADLKTMVETKKVTGTGILLMDNYLDRIQILQNMIHCADLSNPTKPLPIYQNWVARVMQEFFLQGDKERSANLDISPMCDRQTASVEKTQVSFIDFIVYPLWETWADLVHPDVQCILERLQENRDWYSNQIVEE